MYSIPPFIGMLRTDEPITRAFSLHERMVMRIYIYDYFSSAQRISRLMWYHNGTELTPNDRVAITGTGTSLTITNMTVSDAGKYEVKIYSQGTDPEICNRNLMPMLENLAVYAPVTFLLQEYNPPIYNPEDIIIDYVLPAYHGCVQQSFVVDNNIVVNAAAVLNLTGTISYGLFLDGVDINEGSTYNSTVSYNGIIKQSLWITYNNTDDIAGHYVHAAEAYILKSNGVNCPYYYFFLQLSSIPIFSLYWNIRPYGKLILS